MLVLRDLHLCGAGTERGRRISEAAASKTIGWLDSLTLVRFEWKTGSFCRRNLLTGVGVSDEWHAVPTRAKVAGAGQAESRRRGRVSTADRKAAKPHAAGQRSVDRWERPRAGKGDGLERQLYSENDTFSAGSRVDVEHHSPGSRPDPTTADLT